MNQNSTELAFSSNITLTKSPFAAIIPPLVVFIVFGTFFYSVMGGVSYILALIVAIGMIIEAVISISTTKLEINGDKEEAYFVSYLGKKIIKGVTSIEYKGIPMYEKVIIKGKGNSEIVLKCVNECEEIKEYIDWFEGGDKE